MKEGVDNADNSTSLLDDGDPSSHQKKKLKPMATSTSRNQQTETTENVKKLGRRRKSLDLLPTMPLDILYEVLGQLHPRDLVSLSKANKLFRETLLSDGMRVVWKRALEAHGAPECPSDIKEHRWVEFLFISVCEICGKKNVHVADFLIRRRLCGPCRKRNIILLSKIKKEVSMEVLDLLPYSTSAPAYFSMLGDPEKRSSRRYFFILDVTPMAIKLAELNRLAMNSVESKEKLKQYKEIKTKAIQDMQLTVNINQKWLKELYAKRHDDEILHQRRLNEIQDKRSKDVVSKLVALGYTTDDISLVKNHAELKRSVALSNPIWKRIRPILEKEIHDIRQKEAEERRAVSLTRRRDIVESVYSDYKASLSPFEWKYLPRVSDICKFAPFMSLIEAPSDTMVRLIDFAPAMKALPDLLRQYKETRLATFRSQVLLPASVVTVGDNAPVHSEIDVLDLAVAVFRCCAARKVPHGENFPMIGVEDLLSHHCELPRAGLKDPFDYNSTSRSSFALFSFYGLRCEFYENEKTFSLSGSHVSRILVWMAGLDPNTALAAEMDQMDLRFYCDRCREKDTYRDKFAFSWRAAIGHALESHNTTDNADEMLNDIWRIVPEIEATEIKAQELADACWERSIWGCAHCTMFGESFKIRGVIIEHVRTQHGIPFPKQFGDFIVLNRSDIRYFTHHSALPL